MTDSYNFELFRNDERIMVTNQFCVDFHITFVKECDAYEVYAYAKEYPYDSDCDCDDDQAGQRCMCNWNFERSIVMDAEEHSVVDIVTKTIDEINKVKRCTKCQRSYESMSDYTTICASCFLQDLIDKNLPNIASCSICMDEYTITQEKKLPCTHCICKRCYSNLKQKKCPICRADCNMD